MLQHLRFRLTLLIAALALPLSVHATTYYVRTSGSDSNNGQSASTAWKTMTKAVAVAASGDTIYVGAGTYTGALSPTNSGSSATQIIQYIADTSGTNTGDSGDVTLTVSSGSTLTIAGKNNITFQGFTLKQSSSGTVVSITTNASNITLDTCSITQGGTGISINAASANISNCTISSLNGVGLSINASGKSIVVTNSIINSCTGDGISSANSNLTVTRSTITNNTGDGIQASAGTAAIDSCVIAGNTGNGVYAAGADPVTIYNCTIAGNTGSGLSKTPGNAAITVQNCIFANNTGYGITATGVKPTESYNLYYNNTSGAANHTSGGAGTVNANPKFVNAPLGDYRLQATSPALGAGSAIGSTLDRDGLARGSTYDIGAYQSSVGIAAANVPYSFDFNSPPGSEWSMTTRAAGSGGYAFSSFSGPFGKVGTTNQQQVLALNVTPGTTYTLSFDLLILDNWSGEAFTVTAGGATIFSQTFNGGGTWGSTTFIPAPYSNSTNIGGNSNPDRVWRQAWAQFTPASPVVYLTFTAACASNTSTQSWGIDNVSVVAAANPSTPYTCDFSAVPGPEWSLINTTNDSTLGRYSGPFGRPTGDAPSPQQSQTLTLSVTPGQTYYVAFDFLPLKSWDGSSTSYGPDSFTVLVNGVSVFSSTFTNFTSMAQSYPFNPDAWADGSYAIYRRVWFSFTPSTSTAAIAFRGDMNQSISDESWAIENVAVRAQDDPNLFNSSLPGGMLVNSMPRFRDATSSLGLNIAISDASASVGGIHVADLNNDGLQDFIIGAGSSGAYRVLTSSPSPGVYAMNSITFSSGSASRYGVLLDYDRDGYMDYYGYDLNGNAGSFYRGAASLSGTWSPVTSSGLSGVGSRRCIAALDLNADAASDLVIFDGWNPVYAALNLTPTTGTSPRTPTFALNTTTLPQSGGWGSLCSTADINNNGRFGLFYALGTGKLWSPDSSGAYSAITRNINYSSSNGAYASAWADFNNDGWPDLVITGQYWGPPAIYRNPGNTTGNFIDVNNASAASNAGLPYASITAPNVQRGVAWGDYDNDGYLDLFICTTTGGRLYHNNADGTFTQVYEGCAAYQDAVDAAFVDYDNDGDLDLVVTMGSNGTTRVFENLSNLISPNTNYLKVRVMAKDTAGAYTIQDTRARIELWNAAGTTLLQRRDIGAQRGLGTEPFWAHFGGVNPSTTYTVKVYYPGGSATQTVIPNAVTTTIGSRTIAQMLTVQISPSRPKIASWTSVNPN